MADSSLDIAQGMADLTDRIHGTCIPPGADYGQIHPGEAEFLVHRILEERPRCLAEIGTAAGVSTAYTLGALELGAIEARVTAVECLDHCYFDPARKPGFVLDAAYPEKPDTFRLITGVSSAETETLFAKEEIEFLFIDANHTHPWAALDTLFALPCLAPGALVVYHDINLHLRGGERKRDHTGPHYLFYHLPAAEKLVVGEFPYPNIGSFRLVTPQEETLANVLDVLFRFAWRPGAWPDVNGALLATVESFIRKHWGDAWAESFVTRCAGLDVALRA